MMRIQALAAALMLALAAPAFAQDADDVAPVAEAAGKIAVETVEFPSLDDAKTKLVGYLYKPASPAPNAPAIVLMHGRGGLYSTLAKGVYDANTINARHKYWARYWAERGYYALLVDGFGPRGYPTGFGRGSYKDRPEAVNEVTVRPLDAYGALKYLRTLPGVDDNRIALMGWSNGGSTTLAAMADDKPGDMKKLGFKAGISFYPGCGLKKRFDKDGYKPYAPVLVFMGTDDEEVSPKLCRSFVRKSKQLGSPIELIEYDGATHSFDTPIKSRQSVEANAKATADVRQRAGAFLAQQLGN
ncbi:MAG TPA: dienelactone hydrolase family protein [Caulobacteraceae bacterium]|nr:dienelactone hydrolase family protein [Caulobacteraceae bacterium]